MRPLIIILAVAFCTYATSLLADTHYVSLTGTNEHPYLTWATASNTIQAAIDVADEGDTVTVAEGTYCENIYFPVYYIALKGTGPGNVALLRKEHHYV